MPIEIKIEYKDEILYCTATGEFTLNSARATFVELLESSIKNKAAGVLIDCRLLNIDNMSTMDTYSYAETVANELFNYNYFPKLAYLFTSKEINALRKFGENVAANRGAVVQLFDDITDALKWLGDN
jgi:hypothetical protein